MVQRAESDSEEHLIKSNVHLIHQVNVELTQECLELLGVLKGICPHHLLPYNPYHRVLTKKSVVTSTHAY